MWSCWFFLVLVLSVCLILLIFVLAGLGLVLVLFQYEYQGRDGAPISIKPNERYILLAKTNEHWWQVREDHRSRIFYIPAKYVKELPPDGPSLLDFADPPQTEPMLLQTLPVPVPVPVPVPKPLEEPPGTKTRAGDQVKIRLRPDGPTGYRKTENRMSTFGVPLEIQDPAPLTVLWNTPPGPAESSSTSRTTNMVDDSLKQLTGFLEDVRYGTSRIQSQAIPVESPMVPDQGDLQDKDQDPQETLIEPDEEEEEEDDKQEQEEEVGSVKDEESNHIYESIQDLNLDLDSLLPDRQGPESSADPVTLPPTQVRQRFCAGLDQN